MGIWSSLFGKSRSKGADAQFVTSEAVAASCTNQVAMLPQTLANLRDCGVAETSALKLEFFFYTNAHSKAQGLRDALRARRYVVECEPTDDDLYVITGWSQPVAMSEPVTASWTKEMAGLGLEHDCAFDGWGTTPEQ